MKCSLTKAVIADLMPSPDRKERVWDTKCPGFGVYVTPNGAKSFFVEYRIAGKARRQTIGKVGTFTVEEARKQAVETLAAVNKGGDPLRERMAARKGITLREFWPEYLSDAQTRWKPRTSQENVRRWDNFIEPALGGQRLDGISTQDVAAFHRRLKATPTEANRCLALLRTMFAKAIEWEYVADNPATRVSLYPEKARERFLSLEELSALMAAIRAEEELGGRVAVQRSQGRGEIESRGVSTHTAGLFRLLIFTGARLNEIQTAEWSFVSWDAERACLSLPDSKTGAKKIWLNKEASEELKRLHALRRQDRWIIEGAKHGSHLVNPQKPWQRVRNKAGLPDLRIHDLRHSFASFAIAQGSPLQVVGKTLGHSQARTTERYAHLADETARNAVNQLSDSTFAKVRNDN